LLPYNSYIWKKHVFNISRDNDERVGVSDMCRAFDFVKALLIDLASSHHSL